MDNKNLKDGREGFRQFMSDNSARFAENIMENNSILKRLRMDSECISDIIGICVERESDGKQQRIIGFDSENNDVILRNDEDNELVVWRNPKKNLRELVEYFGGTYFQGVLED